MFYSFLLSLLLLSVCEENINERIDYLWVYQNTKKENPEFTNKCEKEEYNTIKNGLKEEEENYTHSLGLVNNVQTDYDFEFKRV